MPLWASNCSVFLFYLRFKLFLEIEKKKYGQWLTYYLSLISQAQKDRSVAKTTLSSQDLKFLFSSSSEVAPQTNWKNEISKTVKYAYPLLLYNHYPSVEVNCI